MDDSLKSDIIQFYPIDRSVGGCDDTMVNKTHEMRTNSQDSFESIPIAHQSNSSQATPQSVKIYKSNDISDKVYLVTQVNAESLFMIKDKFHDQVIQVQEYKEVHISHLREPVFKEIINLKTRPDQKQSSEQAMIN